MILILWAACRLTSYSNTLSSLRPISDNLTQIAEYLSIDTIAGIFDSSDTIIFFNSGERLVRADIRHGRLAHLGYRLFPDSTRDQFTLPIYDFIEHYVLLKNLPLPSPDFSSVIKLNNIHPKELNNLRPDSFTVSHDNYSTYQISWLNKKGKLKSIIVPVDYEVLNFSQLPENERRFIEELSDSTTNYEESTVTVQAKEIADGTDLSPTYLPNCFILRDHELISEFLSSDRYYQLSTDTTATVYEILDNSSYPAQSISNMLTGIDIPNNIDVELKMIAYPKVPIIINLSLSRMIGYLISKGCKIFTGLIDLTDNGAEYLIICRNALQGYCHSMKIRIIIDDFNGKVGHATAKITTFIPSNKILSLFADQ